MPKGLKMAKLVSQDRAAAPSASEPMPRSVCLSASHLLNFPSLEHARSYKELLVVQNLHSPGRCGSVG